MCPQSDARDVIGDYSGRRNMVYLRFSLDSGACSGYTGPASSSGVFLEGEKKAILHLRITRLMILL